MKPKKIPVVIIVFFALVMMTACGGTKLVRGAAPIVRMNELSHTGDSISLHLSMRNINGVELNIQSIDFSLSVEDDELFTYQGPAETNITANGIETWTVEVEESPSSKELLDKLQAGDIKSLPYSLEGVVSAMDEGKLRFNNEGHIYPVPGKPGHFR